MKFKKLIACQTTLCMLAMVTLHAKPKLEKVKHGKASVSEYMRTTTYKTGKETIIDFQSFDIANGEKVVFQQYDAKSRVLSRVHGGSASKINGVLSSNGAVYLLNPAGIYLGKTAIIDTAKFLASTGKLSDSDFLSGKYQFTNLQGLIRNEGLIQADRITFIAQKIEQLGKLISPDGMVGLFVGDNVYLTKEVSPLSVKFNAESDHQVNKSEGSFASSSDIYALSIINSGKIKAKNIEIQGSEKAKVHISGTLDGTSVTDLPGCICVSALDIVLNSPIIDVSSFGNAGDIIIGGYPDAPIANQVMITKDTAILADSKDFGNGGKIEILSKDSLILGGKISACGGANSGAGGHIKTHAKNHVHDGLQLRDVSAPSGVSGHNQILAAGPISILTQSDWDTNYRNLTGAVTIDVTTDTPGDQLITLGQGNASGGLTDADFAMASSALISITNTSADIVGVITLNGANVTSTAGTSPAVTLQSGTLNFQGGSGAIGQVTSSGVGQVINVETDTVNLLEFGSLNFGTDIVYSGSTGGAVSNLTINNGTISQTPSLSLGVLGTSMNVTTITLQGGLIETTGGSSNINLFPSTFVFGDATSTNASEIKTQNNLTIGGSGIDTVTNLAGTLDITINMAGGGNLTFEQGIGEGTGYRESPLIINANGGDVEIGTMLSATTFIDNTIGTGGTPVGDITINDPSNFTIDGPILCKSFTITGATDTVTFNTRFVGATEQTVLGGLTTSGAVAPELPLLSAAGGLGSNVSDGGDVFIDASAGENILFGDLYDIDASAGRSYSSTLDTYNRGGNVTLKGGSNGVTVNGINTLGGSGFGSRSQEQLGGNITITSPTFGVVCQGKWFAASLPIQGASSDNLSNFTSSGIVSLSTDVTAVLNYVKNTSSNVTGGLTSTEGSVFVPTISCASVLMPQPFLSPSGMQPTSVFCPTFQTIGSLDFNSVIGNIALSAGIVNINYADTVNVRLSVDVDALYQFEGVSSTTFQSSITSMGLVNIQNSGDISVNDITITGGSNLPPSTGPANLTLQPSDTFTPTATQGNLPNGTLQLLGNLDVGTGDICLAENPRTSTNSQGADLSIASIYNDSSATLNLSGSNLILGPQEVLTSFGNINFVFTESITVGDVVSAENINLDAPQITVTAHTGSEDLILNNKGELVVNPTGAHILARDRLDTPSGKPMLSGAGELLVEGGIDAITQDRLTLVNPMLARNFLIDDNDFVLNFYPNEVPPPVRHSGGVYHVYDQYDSINGIHFQTYMLEKQNDLYQHTQASTCKEITDFLKNKKYALSNFWKKLGLCDLARQELLNQAIKDFLEERKEFEVTPFFYWLKGNPKQLDAYHMLDAIVTFKEDITESSFNKLDKSRLQMKVNAAFWPKEISALMWIELLEIAKYEHNK